MLMLQRCEYFCMEYVQVPENIINHHQLYINQNQFDLHDLSYSSINNL